jgi:hypothetical protein
MTRPEYGETWVYESIIGALPGVDISERAALAVQFAVFEAGVLSLAAVYGLWDGALAGTVAVLVATAGSFEMLRISKLVRRADPPDSYRRLVFGSSIEVVLGVFAFAALIVYLFVVESVASSGSLLVSPEDESGLAAFPTDAGIASESRSKYSSACSFRSRRDRTSLRISTSSQ